MHFVPRALHARRCRPPGDPHVSERIDHSYTVTLIQLQQNGRGYDVSWLTKTAMPLKSFDVIPMNIKTVAFFLLVALKCVQSAHWLDAVAARSNSLQTTWKAAVSPRFQNISRLEVVAMMGVPMPEHQRSLVSLPKSSSASSLALPTAFSVLEQWPQCGGHIMDQGVPSCACVCVTLFQTLFQAIVAPAGPLALALLWLTASVSRATHPRCGPL